MRRGGRRRRTSTPWILLIIDAVASFTSVSIRFHSNNARWGSDHISSHYLGHEKSLETDLGLDVLSERIVDSLDIRPVIRGLACHAGTVRGRNAILKLIGEDDDISRSSAPGSRSTTLSNRRRVNLYRRWRPRQSTDEILMPIAQSSAEARQEYELVEQAMLVLNNTFDDLTYPPLYGADSSPFETDSGPDTDHDEWLDFAGGDEWTLEHVLQADQVVGTLLKIYEWGNHSSTSLWAPGLAMLGAGRISVSELQHVHEEIAGTVEIVRWRTYADPAGRKSFTFRLSEGRFPSLSNLRQRESDLVESMENQLKTIQRKQKGTTEILECEGRMVISIPKTSNPSELGIVRWTDTNGGRCYVEPHSIVLLGDELVSVRHTLSSKEREITLGLIYTIMEAATAIEQGLSTMARLDVLFAKAAFGTRMNGAIPKVQHQGMVHVSSFVHPALALRDDSTSIVPIDLTISDNAEGARALIISGPNGGGKTVALKSFGLAGVLCRLGMPIPQAKSSTRRPRVDYFDNILVEVGDQQNVMEGESTLMARLNACASVITRVAQTNEHPTYSLVLLDELGGGTDPTAGGAIAQAVLEKLLETDTCRIIATTHSARLKALSYDSDTFQCATVLLRDDGGKYKRPTFQLKHGEIGDSYALGAASRCSPALPDDVLQRAANLMSASEETEGEYIRALTQSLEKQLAAAQDAQTRADTVTMEAKAYRDAMRSLAGAYDQQWTALEERLENMYKELQKDKETPPIKVVGQTLSTLRLVREKIKSDAEILRERGLKLLPIDYKLQTGESVVILADGEWEGTSATVVEQGSTSTNVTVMPGVMFASGNEQVEESIVLTLPRHELAIWDYDSVFEDDDSFVPPTSVRESKQRLQSLLSTITTNNNDVKPKKKSEEREGTTSSRFQSSRQRKAAGKRKNVKKGATSK